ncbi:hypothetical protein VTL71DRAFT_7178 [Oculimacula yallundae]|uniref:Uncharacterized protein n=1 Tax=Oculimacula yallundae TaxID=86028 RepID=A0ABR4BW01_9HELO
MSDQETTPSAAYEAWRASVVRTPTALTQPIVQSILSPPTQASAVTDGTKPNFNKNQPNKGKKFRPVELSEIAPNFFNPSRQVDFGRSRGGSRAMSNDHHASHNGNGPRAPNVGFGNPHQGGHREARRWGPARPVDMNGLTRGMNGLAVGGLRTAPTPTAPLTKFTNFETLPYELRLLIWGHALNDADRILEVIWDGAEKDLKTASHYYYRLSPRSCRAPALMHVCPESRAEALKFYTPVDFTTTLQNADQQFNKCGTIMSYYSPKKDTLLFGEHTCMWSIVRLLHDLRRVNVDVERIAILASGSVVNCHDWNHDDPIHGPDEMDMTYGYAIAGGCSVMEALHGRHKDVAWTDMAAGVKGLKEVSFVVPTHLLSGTAGKVDDSITFRPARGNGLTKGQVSVKNDLQRQVDLVEAGGILPGCSMGNTMNNWAGDKKPSFQFVSFAPKAYTQGMGFDSMIVASDDLLKLSGKYWQFVKNLEQVSRCRIKIPQQDYYSQPSREIGFYGTASGIEQAVKLIRDRLAHLSGSNWKAPKYPKFAPGYTGTLDLKFGPRDAASSY